MAAGLARASAVVVTYHDTASALKILQRGRRACAAGAGDRAHAATTRDLEKLQAAGATEVVPEAIEGSLMLARHALALVGVPMRRVIRAGAGPARRALQPAARLLPRRRRRHRRRARAGAAASGDACRRRQRASASALADLALHAVGVTVVAVRRAGGAVTNADDELVLGAGDTLVLSGQPEPLALAEAKLLGKT